MRLRPFWVKQTIASRASARSAVRLTRPAFSANVRAHQGVNTALDMIVGVSRPSDINGVNEQLTSYLKRSGGEDTGALRFTLPCNCFISMSVSGV